MMVMNSPQPLIFATPCPESPAENDPSYILFLAWCKPIVKFADILSLGLGTSYKLSQAFGSEVREPDGNWTGTVGMVNRGEADLSLNTLIMTQENEKDFEFSYPINIESVTFATRASTNAPDITTIFQPFNLSVWLSIALSAIVMALILYRYSMKKRNVVYVFEKVVASLLQQSSNFKHGHEKCLMFTWLLGSTILICCYLSVLLSFLMFPQTSIIRNIRELSREVKKGRYHVVSNLETYVEMLYDSEDESAKIIGESILKNSKGLEDVMNFILLQDKTNVALVDTKKGLTMLKNNYFISDDHFFFYLSAVAAKKGFCCKEKLDMIIHKISEAGIYEKLCNEGRFILLLKLFMNRIPNVNPEVPLTLYHLSGAFVILSGGHFVAFVSLLIEIVLNRYKRHVLKTKFRSHRHKSVSNNIFHPVTPEKLFHRSN